MIEGIEGLGHQLVEQFKMHLHPKAVLKDGQHRLRGKLLFVSLSITNAMFKMFYVLFPALPSGLMLLQIYKDFLTYLIDQTRRHLRDITGLDLWSGAEDRVEILLTHPNRWGTPEQQFLEQAVVAAGIMSQEDALNRLKFAEESEAAASFCLPTAGISPKITVCPATHPMTC